MEQQHWQQSQEIVSFNDEALVLVDEFDQAIGFLDKASAHVGQGQLHRAFSLFVFNLQGQLLLQQRAASKRLWPGYWSNTCCSHPRQGERLDQAIQRRLREELGLSCEFQFLFKFQYQAQFDANGAEHELCSVYAGYSVVTPILNRNEVAALRYVSPQALDQEITEQPQCFTPWFKIEWERLRREHAEVFQPRA